MNLQMKTPYFKRNPVKNASNTQGNNIVNAFVNRNITHLPSTAPSSKRRQHSFNFFKDSHKNANQPEEQLSQVDRAYLQQKQKWIELRERLRMREVFVQDRPKTSGSKKQLIKSKITENNQIKQKNTQINDKNASTHQQNAKTDDNLVLFYENKEPITQILKKPQIQEIQSQSSANKPSYKSARTPNRSKNLNASQTFRQMIKIYTAKNHNQMQNKSKQLQDEPIQIINRDHRRSRARKHKSDHFSHISNKEMEDRLMNRPEELPDRRIIYRKTESISATLIYSLEISTIRRRTIVFVEFIGEKYKKFTHVLPIQQSLIFNDKLKNEGDVFVGEAIEINLIQGIIINMNALKLHPNGKVKIMKRQPSKQSNLSRKNINRIDSKSILIGDKFIFTQQYPTQPLKSDPSSSNLDSQVGNIQILPQTANVPQNQTIIEESGSFIRSIPQENNSKMMGGSAIVSQIQQSKEIQEG